MEVLSAELVQSLVRWKGGGKPVVSLYLNVDGRDHVRPEDYLQHLEALIRDAQHDQTLDLEIDRIRSYVRDEFERGGNRGLAIFSSGDDLWKVVALPLPVTDRLTVNSTPHVRSLENILDDNQTIGVLLTDKQRARLLVIELGKVAERDEIVDPLPRHDDDKGDWRKDHVKAHASVSAKQHLRHAANEMFELYKKHSFSHLVLSVSDELRSELERQLHAYLRPKVVGRCNLPMTAGDEEIIDAARALTREKERVTEDKFVERLRAGLPASTIGSTSRGRPRLGRPEDASPDQGIDNGDSHASVAGLDPTLKAIFEKRVETLLVSEGFVAQGWRCRECHYIATLGRKCAMCGTEMSLVEDVIEEAVEDALAQKCHVEFCRSNADLDVMGQIGALLRF